MQPQLAPYLTPRPVNRRGPHRRFWFHLAACLVVWPMGFGTVFIATFVAMAIVYNSFGGPLFWPLAWIISSIAFGLVVGIPLAVFGRSRRWYLRLIPAVIAAVPLIWLGVLAAQGTIPVGTVGVLWALPSIAIIAISILLQTARWWRPVPDSRNQRVAGRASG